ncbi:MAG TPA: hypothetical protein VNO18_15210 [Xanthobacteraceae bacterium]|nr:hypothetical protein [Xanthobacteraceae bacterium]
MIVPLKLLNEYTIEHAIAVNAKAGKERTAPSKIPSAIKRIAINIQMHSPSSRRQRGRAIMTARKELIRRPIQK